MLRIQPPLAFSNGVFLENRIFYISFLTTLFMLLFDKPYHGKKRIWIYVVYPISFVKIFASIVTVSEQQKARPGSTAAHKSSTFYRDRIKTAAQQGNGKSQQKWQKRQC
jgi:hypothetical protein